MSVKFASSPFVYQPSVVLPSSAGKLCGLSLAVKDLFHIAGINTSAGNPQWLDTHDIPQNTSSIVESLINSGASFVGKTITDELAYSLNGINQHYGMPINHKAKNRIIGGSSSGSAAAVVNKEADIGLGTDTGGSIRVPSSYCGLFGIRTTHGVLSTDNMVALAPSFDTVGWMTRDIDTLLSVAEVLLPTSKQTVNQQSEVGFANQLFQQSSFEIEATQWADNHLTGYEILNDLLPYSFLSNASETFKILQGWEIWQTHKHWLTTNKPKIADDIQARLDWCEQITEKEYAHALDQQSYFKTKIASLMSDYSAIVLPTAPGPAPKIETESQHLAEYRDKLLSFTCLAGLTGQPQVHLPLFQYEQAPVGLSILGRKNSDIDLIRFARNIMDQNSEH